MRRATDIENVLGAALSAVDRGTDGMALEQGAVDVLRHQFGRKIELAMANPGWRQRWRAERCYVLEHAEAMGRCAARLAVEDCRAVITLRDVETAMLKLHGQLPIAGRWCPF